MKLTVLGHPPKAVKLGKLIGEGCFFRHLYDEALLNSLLPPTNFRVYLLPYNAKKESVVGGKDIVQVINIDGREIMKLSVDDDVEILELTEMTVRRYPL